ncbi:hypothetical protein [Streptomyces pakalii]|uniref:Uncharacterized protein n=1 Tax=Streptomyces pakalii TaxID=3036494 RepID=A0ABT7DH67_9ACTN|nr:hypothetical protein [Streptomyces pakalii]MDJ1645180.1 hypothetical protein [Streptomyces pakalii]
MTGARTPMRSHAGEPAHKSSAEKWIAANSTEARLGQFASDAQAARRRGDDHA